MRHANARQMTQQDQPYLHMPDERHVEKRQLLRQATEIQQVPALAERIRYQRRQYPNLRNEKREVMGNIVDECNWNKRERKSLRQSDNRDVDLGNPFRDRNDEQVNREV